MYWWYIVMLVILQCSSFASVLVDLGVAFVLAALGILRFIVKFNLCIQGPVLTARAIP
jgi:hypothetical protein